MSTVCFTTTEDSTQGVFIKRNQPEEEFPVEAILTEDSLSAVFLASLAPSEFSLRHILPVSITQASEGYIASFVDANIHASGETEWEAIESLKMLIIDAYQMLLDMEPSSLGPMPSKQLAILQSFIKPT